MVNIKPSVNATNAIANKAQAPQSPQAPQALQAPTPIVLALGRFILSPPFFPLRAQGMIVLIYVIGLNSLVNQAIP